MDWHWQTYNAWVAHFDLLGFREKLKTQRVSILQQEVDEIVSDLQGEATECENSVDCLFYADAFIFYSKSGENRDYPGLLHVATHFMQKCISKGVALRGALAYGEIAISSDKRILMGSAFLDSHQYGEDQNWLGLVLTPAATDRLKEAKLDPARHGFVYGEIPRRECSEFDHKAYAYSFCRGATNFPCPLVVKLGEMQHFAPRKAKIKYENTIRFVEKHWRMIEC